MTTFDPAAWTRRFEAVGGSLRRESDDGLVTVRNLFRRPLDEQERSCAMVGEIAGNSERIGAVLGLLDRR